MPSPKGGYHLANGDRVPSVTTILGRFKDSGGLMQWAFQQGRNGKDRLYEEAEKAADIGTCAHHMVELRMQGKPDEELTVYLEATLPDLEMQAKARSAFAAYEAWARNFNVKVVDQECQLISEIHRYGGTPDFIGLVGNQLALFDIKTSNAIYADHLVQVAAYGQLWNETHPETPIIGGYHILRFAKESADFAHHYFANLDEGWKQFLLLREAYEIDKVLKKRAA